MIIVKKMATFDLRFGALEDLVHLIAKTHPSRSLEIYCCPPNAFISFINRHGAVCVMRLVCEIVQCENRGSVEVPLGPFMGVCKGSNLSVRDNILRTVHGAIEVDPGYDSPLWIELLYLPVVEIRLNPKEYEILRRWLREVKKLLITSSSIGNLPISLPIGSNQYLYDTKSLRHLIKSADMKIRLGKFLQCRYLFVHLCELTLIEAPSRYH